MAVRESPLQTPPPQSRRPEIKMRQVDSPTFGGRSGRGFERRPYGPMWRPIALAALSGLIVLLVLLLLFAWPR
jgi:hypothetical protein